MIEDFLHLPPVSLTPVANLELRISPRIFEKIRNDPNGILRGLGETDSWKKQEVKNPVTLSLYRKYGLGFPINISIFKQEIFETGKRKFFGKMWRMWRFPKFSLTISLNMCMICSVCRKFYIWNIFYFREDLRDFAKFCGKKRIFAIIEIFFVATISRKYLALLCLLGKYPCLVTKVPVEPIFPTQVGMYLQKNSPLTPLFW